MVSVQAKEIEIGLDWNGLAFRPGVFLLFTMSLMGLMMTGDWVLSDWLEVSLDWTIQNRQDFSSEI